MKSVSPSQPTLRRRAAFTLIETAMAMAIVGFAFVGILGLLPCGMQTFRHAMDKTLETQMTQNLVGQAGLGSYASLAQFAGQSFCFDDSGNIVSDASPAWTYTAKLALETQTTVPGAPAFANAGLARLTITYYRKAVASTAPPFATFVTYIVNRAGDAAQ